MDDSSAADSRAYLIHKLRQQLGRCEPTISTADAAECPSGMFSSGTAAIDRLLPGGGLRRGMLVEWLAEQEASGAATLSLLSAREASLLGGVVVVIDRRQTFYPPAAAAWGIDPDRLIVVHPQTARDELWAMVQSLRSPVVAAVWATIKRIDDRAFRRLQLAAEAGRTLGLLLRPASARGQPSWADVRLWVDLARQGDMERGRQGEHRGRIVPLSPCLPVSLSLSARHVHVRVLRCHGGRSGDSACLEIDDVDHAVREVKESSRLSALGHQPSLLADSR